MANIYYCNKCNKTTSREGFYFDFSNEVEKNCFYCKDKCLKIEIEHNSRFFLLLLIVIIFAIGLASYMVINAFIEENLIFTNQFILYLLLWIVISISIIIGFGIIIESFELNLIKKKIMLHFQKQI